MECNIHENLLTPHFHLSGAKRTFLGKSSSGIERGYQKNVKETGTIWEGIRNEPFNRLGWDIGMCS